MEPPSWLKPLTTSVSLDSLTTVNHEMIPKWVGNGPETTTKRNPISYFARVIESVKVFN